MGSPIGVGFGVGFADLTDEDIEEKLRAVEELMMRPQKAAYGALGVSIFGLVANIISAYNLTTRKTGTARLLRYLTFTDIVLLLSMDMSVYLKDIDPPQTHRTLKELVDCVYPFVYPLFQTTRMFQFYLTALISVERCLALTMPLKFATMNRESLTTTAVIINICVSVVFNIPYWVLFHPELYLSESFNTTLIRPVELVETPVWFVTFDTFPSMIFNGVVPLAILSICNIILIISQFRLPSRQGRGQVRQGRGQLTLLIVAITCMSMATIISLHIYKVVKLTEDQKMNRECASKLLCTINSSTNFLFYCMFGREFRKGLVELCTRRPRVQEPRLTTSNVTPSQV